MKIAPDEGLMASFVKASTAPTYALCLDCPNDTSLTNEALENIIEPGTEIRSTLEEYCRHYSQARYFDLPPSPRGENWRFLVECFELEGQRWTLAKGITVPRKLSTDEIDDLKTKLHHERDVFTRAQRIAGVSHVHDNIDKGHWHASDTFFEMLGRQPVRGNIRYGDDNDLPVMSRHREALTARHEDSKADTAPPRIELETTRQDTGEPVYLEVSTYPEYAQDGSIAGYFSIVTDVSEFQLLRQGLEEERSLHERAQRLAKLGHFVFDPTTQKVSVSSVLLQLAGLEPDKAPDEYAPLFRLLASEEEVRHSQIRLNDFLENPVPYETDIPIRRANDGEPRIMALSINPDQDEDGHLRQVFGTIQDVTQERRLARDLEIEQERFERAQRLGKIGHAVDDISKGEFIASGVLWELLGMAPPRTTLPYEEVAKALLPPELAEHSLKRRAAAAKTGEPYKFEFSTKRQDTGAPVIFSVENYPQKDKNGNVISFFSIVADVTAQRLLEKDLQVERESFARAQRLARVGHFTQDLSTHQIDASEIVWNMLGFESGGQPRDYEAFTNAFFNARQRDVSLERRRQLIQSGTDISYEIDMPRADTGDIGTFAVAVHPDRNAAGEVDKFFGVIADVTEARRLESSLRDERHLFARAQELARLGHYIDDLRDGSFVASDMMWKMGGLLPGEPPPKSFDELLERFLTPQDRRTSRERRAEALRTGEPYREQVSALNKRDGTNREYWAEVFPEKDESGQVIRFFGIVQDITERLQSEAARERLEQALQDSQKLEALNYFAGGMAHELSNLLQPALNFGALAHSAAARGNTEAMAQYTDRVLAAVTRATEVTRRALQYVRDTPSETGSISLQSAIADAKMILRSTTPLVEWNIDPSLHDAKVISDATALLQVLLNLVRNAVESGGAGTGIEIHLSPVKLTSYEALRRGVAVGDYVMMTVKDNGPGIDGRVRNRIFDPLVTTKTEGRGTGLGLPVSKGLTERWGGTLYLASSDSLGTVFTVLIPLVHADISTSH